MGLGAVYKAEGTTAMVLGQATAEWLQVPPSKQIALVFLCLFPGRTTLRVDGFPARAGKKISGKSMADLAYFFH